MTSVSTWFGRIAILATLLTVLPAAHADKKTSSFFPNEDDTFLALRDAARRNDAAKATEFAARLSNYAIPSYVDYYRLRAHMVSASSSEIRNFLDRYNGSAIADRLRNDWLHDLGTQQDWTTFDEQYPLFVLNDDIQVKCFALVSRAVKGQNVAAEARTLLLAPRDYGNGCAVLISTLLSYGQFDTDDLWTQIRLAAETHSIEPAQRIAALLDIPGNQIAHAIDMPAVTLLRGLKSGRAEHEMFLIALGRSAKASHEKAAKLLNNASNKLTVQEQALGWAQIALAASFQLAPEALGYWYKTHGAPLSYEGHQWKVRTALRNGDWPLVKSAIEAMPAPLANEPAWIYWLGRALLAEGKQEDAKKLWASIADKTNFYGQLALEEMGQKITIPKAGLPLTTAEIGPMASKPGFMRALKFFTLNLRFEGTREWNWELRKMTEREHLAAAEFARQNNILDRMVYTSDKTKTEFDFTQRFPSPFRDRMIAATQKIGIDMAWAYGLIRQESRFLLNARSQVGASGLMQLMPATAKYVAKKIGMGNIHQNQVNDTDTNILLGTNYLSMVLNDLDGSQALATAAYNAGPGRPRAWRLTLPRPVEGAIFAESIPFTETRGYVKNVLSNATYYAALFENKPQSLKARLGTVSPKGSSDGTSDLP